MTSVASDAATSLGHLLDLSLTDQRGGIGRGDVLGDAADDFGTGGVHQPGQLLEMFGRRAARRATLCVAPLPAPHARWDRGPGSVV